MFGGAPYFCQHIQPLYTVMPQIKSKSKLPPEIKKQIANANKWGDFFRSFWGDFWGDGAVETGSCKRWFLGI